MLHVIGCIVEQHDLRLVALAALLCLLASFTAVNMIARARVAHGRMRNFWVVAASVVTGTGIWGTHFVAMLAFDGGLAIGFDQLRTLLSVLVAVLLCGAGFALCLSQRTVLLGGVVTGVAICAMHFTGMWALRVSAVQVWDADYVEAAIAIGVLLSAAAVKVAFGKSGGSRRLGLGAVILTVAICGLHFTGMSALQLRPDPTLLVPDVVLEPATLAIAIAMSAMVIVALGCVGALFDHHLAERANSETEKLRAHVTELEETKSELEAIAVQLNIALDAAAAANISKTQFLAAMSHELRTPLNAIIGFSQLMDLQVFGPLGNGHYEEYAKDIHASGSHLLSLINDVLDLSRLDAGQTSLSEEEIDVMTFAHEAARMVEGQAGAADVTLRRDIAPDLPRLYGDIRRVRQSLLNLLSNAIKFTPGGGSVTLSAGLHGDEIVLAVSDTGIGIAEDDIPKALEPFKQLDGSLSRKYEGVGLGLALCKQFTELHGGRIDIDSTLHVGTTVTLRFPASRTLHARRVA